MPDGTVVSINITPDGAQPMTAVEQVNAVAGQGLEGDRYFKKTGTYSTTAGTGREVTLIESEAIEALERDYEMSINPGDARRNIVTRGIALNHYVGKEFRVGDVTLRGVRLNEPCNHLAALTDQKVKTGLVHRGGLRADIVNGGIIRVGDPIQSL
jgi:MOSC domain-containing protein YiiM